MGKKQRLQIYADLPANLQRADQLLGLYGQWAVNRGGRAGRCGSAEGQYVPERGEVETRREPKVEVLTTEEALRCQRALLAVPDRERIVLTILYVPKPMPAEQQLRLMRIPPQLSQQRHAAGVRFWWNRYQILEKAALDKAAGQRSYNASYLATSE